MGSMGGCREIKMASASTLSLNEPAGPHFSHHRKAKTNDKRPNLSKNCILWYKSRSVRFSILGENPSEEVLDYDSYYSK